MSLLLLSSQVAGGGMMLSGFPKESPQPEGKPNVIYILADDLGYGDIEPYGQRRIRTPHLSRMAEEGMMFSQHYAGCTVSAPSRGSLMTGMHTGHAQIRGNREVQPEGQQPMRPGTYTLGTMMKAGGYATGIFGKWGLGYPGSGSTPTDMGFDRFYGYNCQRQAHSYYPEHLWSNDRKVVLEENLNRGRKVYSQQLIHEEALAFIRENRDTTFFAMLTYTLPHAELNLPHDSIYRSYENEFDETPYDGRYGYQPVEKPRASFAAMVTTLDHYVGEILAELKRLGIDDRTIVMFTSDNGPHREGGADPAFFNSSGELRGIKRDLYEGGIRVPFIVRYPGVVEAGKRADHPCAFWDVMPTLAELARVEVAEETDGISFWPTLVAQGKQEQHPFLYWEFHEGGGKRAVRRGDWKLVVLHVDNPEKRKVELYHLGTDAGEREDVAGQYPEVVAACLLILSPASARERMLWNEGWRFKKLEQREVDTMLAYNKIREWILPSGNRYLKSSRPYIRPARELNGGVFSRSDFDDSKWRRLDLPHDWGIEGPFVQELPGETAKLPWMGVAWYRKALFVDEREAGKRFFLEVDGAMSFSTVWCNGELVGGWPYGYASYQLDITPYLKPGETNVIAIRLDNPDISSRWYPGGGIYRNVWLTKTDPVHIAQWGTYITTPEVSSERAKVNLEVSIVNATKEGRAAELDMETLIYRQDKKGNRVGEPVAKQQSREIVLPGESVVRQSFLIDHPAIWDIEAPEMYVAVTALKEGDRLTDRYETPFGIRTIEFTTDDGFHLNDRRVQLNGVCMHHDQGALGAAFHYRAMERQLEILREMGVNAIRTSHNPPAREMLDLCDRMGVMVLDEFVDTWIQPKKANGYSIIFMDWHEQDLRAFIHRDRNHPCVIAWSTGNEIDEQGSRAGHIVSKWLTGIVCEEDPTRKATIGCNYQHAGFNGFQRTTDVFGLNYKPHLYNRFRETNPDIPCYGSETASCISTRGEYLFPVGENKVGGKLGCFMSSYDLYSTSWGSTPDTEFKAQEQAPFSAGEFVWTGFDYLGEPTPFTADMTVLTNYHTAEERARAEKELKEMGKIKVPSRSSYFGIVDLAGFKKDRFYIYQAHWRPDFPMAHILPHWNWEGREGLVTPVHLYTSGDEAELFLNGRSLGRKRKAPFEYRLRWDEVVYEPGELKVVAYKNGRPWAEEIKKTTGPAYRLHLEADRQEMQGDGHDLIFVTVRVLDKEGNLVPRADHLIEFELSGPARIAATDNGDQTSHASFQNSYIKAFNGMALVILKSKRGESGKVVLRAKTKKVIGDKLQVGATAVPFH